MSFAQRPLRVLIPTLALSLAIWGGPSSALAGTKTSGFQSMVPANSLVAALQEDSALADDLERQLRDLTNAARNAYRLAPVEFDPDLLDVAHIRAAAQIGIPDLVHYDANGRLAFVPLVEGSGVEYWLAGENLARFTDANSDTVILVHNALMNSPAHRKNILEPSFNRLAVGIAMAPSGEVAFAEIFRAAP